MALPLALQAVGDAAVLEAFPPADWLEDVLAYVRYECEAVICQEHQARRQLHRFRVQLDSAANLRAGYKSVRPHDKPAFTAIPVREEQIAELHCCAVEGCRLLTSFGPTALRRLITLPPRSGLCRMMRFLGPEFGSESRNIRTYLDSNCARILMPPPRVSSSVASLISGIQLEP